jgi:hypothetical protein
MDHRLRQLERAAASGDLEAQQLLVRMQCRTFGHDWNTRNKVVSTFPIKYKKINENCKRCGIVENEPKARRQDNTSAMEKLLHSYAYGTVEELHREYAKLHEGAGD